MQQLMPGLDLDQPPVFCLASGPPAQGFTATHVSNRQCYRDPYMKGPKKQKSIALFNFLGGPEGSGEAALAADLITARF